MMSLVNKWDQIKLIIFRIYIAKTFVVVELISNDLNFNVNLKKKYISNFKFKLVILEVGFDI
jgi:hypothetical protein